MICSVGFIICSLFPTLFVDPTYLLIAASNTVDEAVEIAEPDFEAENSGQENLGQLSGPARVVADCESGNRLADGTAVPGSWDPVAENPVSSASGAFQFIDGTWRWVMDELGINGYNRALHAPLDVQLQAFEWLWDDGNGKQHWQPSRSCWSQLI